MYDVLFYVFSALVLAGGAAVVFNRNPVNAALLLITSFVGIAGLFFLLEAYFLGVLQVLVYAGAVVVLFLFIIMLLDVKKSPPPRLRTLGSLAAVIAVPLLAMMVVTLVASPVFEDRAIADAGPAPTSLKLFGQLLFTRYLLPMQVAGFLLLVAMIGVIVLSKRRLDGDPEPPPAS